MRTAAFRLKDSSVSFMVKLINHKQDKTNLLQRGSRTSLGTTVNDVIPTFLMFSIYAVITYTASVKLSNSRKH